MMTLEEYVTATARREVASVEKLPEYPLPQGLFYGPRQYRPSKSSKLRALDNYMRVAEYLLPAAGPLRASTMWHSALHGSNIFVDPANRTKMTGIIGWQSVHLSPLFLQVGHPSLIEFDGPVPEDSESIKLPDNFEQLNDYEQTAAKKLYSEQSLYKLYEVELGLRAAEISYALRCQAALTCQITGLAGSLYFDGEPMVEGMLMTIERKWKRIVGTGPDGCALKPCPLGFSTEEKARQR
ncbi:MAG: hypothetical protein M1825_003831 [Sarcosagium campestre]|nr:MAG: hypothetical protein M1825_003831 [Sarcosagium campestre]